jgi:hypothetical protein
MASAMIRSALGHLTRAVWYKLSGASPFLIDSWRSVVPVIRTRATTWAGCQSRASSVLSGFAISFQGAE